MLGSIYVFDFGDFRKVGKSTKALERLSTLEFKYKDIAQHVWISEPLVEFDAAEAIAHSILEKHLISNERFYSSFDDTVKACMSACSRSSKQLFCGVVAGINVMVDPTTGYINATELKRSGEFKIAIGQFLKNDSVKYLNEEINNAGLTSYFSTRGRNSATFVHPYIFIEMNRSMTAKHKVDLYNWMLYEMPNIEAVKKAIKKVSEAS
jgi:hypothetical protein